jgi:predicted AlkP superfamily pyrophosphatase or phosphodiesterase
MFTGAPPHVHGIQKYERPVLQCDTIFDALIRAGKKVAIVAVENSSIDLIFRNRELDYYSEEYDAQVTDRALELLDSGKHDFILAYHQEYDDTLHKTTPRSPEALQAMKNHIQSFDRIARAFNDSWKSYNRVILFASDHGAHIDRDTGKGTHGEDIPEDMHIQHFLGIRKAFEGNP